MKKDKKKRNVKVYTIFLFIIVVFIFLVWWKPINNSEKITELNIIDGDKAYFAGGCFWCTEADLEKVEGVIEVISGYSGGQEINPTYKDVASGKTGHTETIEIVYDPNKVSYKELLYVFWRKHDPTDANGQFVDRGKQYRPAIFYLDEEQRKIAELSKKELDTSGKFNKPIITEIVSFTTFYAAEAYHQDYYKKNPIRYKLYRSGSGRNRFLEETWGK